VKASFFSSRVSPTHGEKCNAAHGCALQQLLSAAVVRHGQKVGQGQFFSIYEGAARDKTFPVRSTQFVDAAVFVNESSMFKYKFSLGER
jgi:hypothetical protein